MHPPTDRAQQRAWGWVSLPLPSREIHSSTLPLCNPRIGHKATLLVPAALFAILGMRTAFMPSFELCMVLCLGPQPPLDIPSGMSPYVSRAWALKPSAAEQGHRPKRPHPTLPGGPSQPMHLRRWHQYALKLDQDHSPWTWWHLRWQGVIGWGPAQPASACFQLQSGPWHSAPSPGADGSCRTLACDIRNWRLFQIAGTGTCLSALLLLGEEIFPRQTTSWLVVCREVS